MSERIPMEECFECMSGSGPCPKHAHRTENLQVEFLRARLADASMPWTRSHVKALIGRIEALTEKLEEVIGCNQDLHASALRLGQALQEAQADGTLYHEIMGGRRRTKMEHGLCEPKERHACTRCEAERRIERMLSEYKGRRVRLT